MRKLTLAIITSFTVLSAYGAEYGYLDGVGADGTTSVTLGAGDRLTVLSHMNDAALRVVLPSGASYSWYISNYAGQITGSSFTFSGVNGRTEDRTVVGPCEIVVRGDDQCYIAYKIDRAVDDSVQPANVTQLPLDVNGEMEVLIETCDDLTLGEWTLVHSATHISDGVNKKYFRTRVIQK